MTAPIPRFKKDERKRRSLRFNRTFTQTRRCADHSSCKQALKLALNTAIGNPTPARSVKHETPAISYLAGVSRLREEPYWKTNHQYPPGGFKHAFRSTPESFKHTSSLQLEGHTHFQWIIPKMSHMKSCSQAHDLTKNILPHITDKPQKTQHVMSKDDGAAFFWISGT